MTSAELLNIGLDELVPAPMYACTATCESWPRRASTAACCSADLLLGGGDLGVELRLLVERRDQVLGEDVGLRLERLELVGDLGDELLLVADRVGGGGRGQGDRDRGGEGHCHDDSPSHPEVAAVHDEARV